MKRIITGLTISFLSISAFAMQGEGFTIISEKNITIGEDAKGWVKKIDGPSAKYASAKTKTYDGRTQVKNNILLQADHFYSVKNETVGVQRYKIHYTLNCLGASNIHDLELELKPNGWVDEGANNFLLIQPSQRGQFTISAVTEIFGESAQRAADEKILIVD